MMRMIMKYEVEDKDELRDIKVEEVNGIKEMSITENKL